MALINCPECGKEISDKSKYCINCGYPLENIEEETENEIEDNVVDFTSNTAKTLENIYQVKYVCPYCKSENYHTYVEETPIQKKGKAKTKTSLNLNPLHPLTIVNHKTTITPGKTKIKRTSMYQCDNCAKTFKWPYRMQYGGNTSNNEIKSQVDEAGNNAALATVVFLIIVVIFIILIAQYA